VPADTARMTVKASWQADGRQTICSLEASDQWGVFS
jgi:hypothetical protein